MPMSYLPRRNAFNRISPPPGAQNYVCFQGANGFETISAVTTRALRHLNIPGAARRFFFFSAAGPDNERFIVSRTYIVADALLNAAAVAAFSDEEPCVLTEGRFDTMNPKHIAVTRDGDILYHPFLSRTPGWQPR